MDCNFSNKIELYEQLLSIPENAQEYEGSFLTKFNEWVFITVVKLNEKRLIILRNHHYPLYFFNDLIETDEKILYYIIIKLENIYECDNAMKNLYNIENKSSPIFTAISSNKPIEYWEKTEDWVKKMMEMRGM